MRYISTRGTAPILSFEEAMLSGLARDGGLYVPQTIPTLDAYTIARMEGEPEVKRTYEFEPLEMLPEWPGNEAAMANDFKAGFEQDENG